MISSSSPSFNKESWHYTNGKVFLGETPIETQSTSDLQDIPLEIVRLIQGFEKQAIFYNGKLAQHLSTIEAKELGDFKSIESEVENPIDFENAEKATLGYNIEIDATKNVDNYAFIFIYGNRLEGETKAFKNILRNQLNIKGKGRVNVFELHIALNEIEFYVNHSIKLVLGKESTCERFRYFWTGGDAYLYDHSEAHLSENSKLKSLNFVTGGKWTRFNELTSLNGKESKAELKHMCALGSGQHSDLYSKLHHRVGENEVVQEHKSLLTGKSKSSFTGMISIEQDAQKANANQVSHNMVLDDRCEVNTRPQLQVSADDVKANHGATVGQLDEEEIFYLQSRALDKDTARQLVTKGLVFSCLDLFDSGALKTSADMCLQASLAQFAREVNNES